MSAIRTINAMTDECGARSKPMPMPVANQVPRIVTASATNALDGVVRWAPVKSLWFSGMAITAIVGGAYTFSMQAFCVFFITTALTLCCGTSLGLHRRLIHGSYECPLWLEHFFVHLSVLGGLAGPFGLMRAHDLRDWAQRQQQCHDYFSHRKSFLIDHIWQLHCNVTLDHPPGFVLEPRIAQDRFYRFMEKTWMLQQLPMALILWWLGGASWLVWGICVRVTVAVAGQWLVAYVAHNDGHLDWHVDGVGIQGYNLKYCSFITMGECWHNNHHAFPGSARFGLQKGQGDPGWSVLMLLKQLGLVWKIKLPEDLPVRPELTALTEEH